MTSSEHKNAKDDYARKLSIIKSDFEDYVNGKVAKEYEQSLVASTDIAIISNLYIMSLNENELLSKVKDIKNLCDNIEYQETVDKFQNLYNVIDSFTKTYQEIQQNVVKCSNEAFEELLSKYNDEKQKFNYKYTEIENENNDYGLAIINYNNASSNYNTFKNSEHQLSLTGAAKEQMSKYNAQMNNYYSEISVLLTELNTSLENMKQYLEDGLKITPVTTLDGIATGALTGSNSIYGGTQTG